MAIDPNPLVWANDSPGGTATSAANFNRITAEVQSEIRDHIAAQAAADSVTYAVLRAGTIVFDGDSITAGNGSTDGQTYPHQATMGLDARFRVFNVGIGGQSATQMFTTDTDVDALLPSSGIGISCGFAGTNDLANGATAAAVYATLVNYFTERRAAGWDRTVAFTLTPRSASGINANFETRRLELNALLRANWPTFADALVDVAAHPVMGVPGADQDPALYADGTHPTNYGYSLIASLVLPALASLGVVGSHAHPDYATRADMSLKVDTSDLPAAMLAAGFMQAVRKNRASNPHAATAATYYTANAGTAGTVAVTQVASGAPDGGAFARATWSVSATSSGLSGMIYGGYGTDLGMNPIPGEYFSAGLWVRCSIAQRVTLGIQHLTTTSQVVESVFTPSVILAAGVWTYLEHNRATPVLATTARSHLLVYSASGTGTPWPAGTTLDVAQVMASNLPAVDADYFDGSTTDTTETNYLWMGTANASTSRAVTAGGSVAAIATPTAPSATYTQAEAVAMKTAVDAIRLALIASGITL